MMPEVRTYLSRIHSAMSSPKLAGEERDSLLMELMEYDIIWDDDGISHDIGDGLYGLWMIMIILEPTCIHYI